MSLRNAFVGGEDGLARRYDMNASVNEEPTVYEGMDGEISAIAANVRIAYGSSTESTNTACRTSTGSLLQSILTCGDS